MPATIPENIELLIVAGRWATDRLDKAVQLLFQAQMQTNNLYKIDGWDAIRSRPTEEIVALARGLALAEDILRWDCGPPPPDFAWCCRI